MATFVEGRVVGFGLDSKARQKSIPWYKEDLGAVPGPARELLQHYGGIAPAEVISHVYRIRDLAWEIDPYPCIGGGTFLQLGISRTLPYHEIVMRVKQGAKLLDVGCCLGQDLRKLVFDGAPSPNIYGIELHAGLIDVGYELFQDRDTLQSTFVAADIFNPTDSLTRLYGHMDIIYAGSFFHPFDWGMQVAAAERLIAFLRRDVEAMIVGQGMAHLKPDSYPTPNSSSKIFKHNMESFERMWRQVGSETGTSWKLQGELEAVKAASFSKNGQWGDPDARTFRFTVLRD